jgi:hypothetical protein
LEGKSPCSESMLPVCTSPKIAVIRQCRVVCELRGVRAQTERFASVASHPCGNKQVTRMDGVTKPISRAMTVTLLKRTRVKAKVGNQLIESRRENHDLGGCFPVTS